MKRLAPRSKQFAVGGGLLCLASLFLGLWNLRAAMTGWLAAFVLTGSLPLGALCLSMMMRIIPGGWREELHETAVLSTLLLPLVFLALVPVLAGLPSIYEWTAASLDGFKGFYLTPAFFALRSLLILAGACVLGALLVRSGLFAIPVAGLISFVILDGLLATDWLVSLDPGFHSSGFGLYFLSVQMLTALCLLIPTRLVSAPVKRPDLLGSLLLTALLFWAYLSFMQYFIIWSGDLPPGVVWYQRRSTGIWAAAEYAIAVLHLLPAFLLLFPPVRRGIGWLAGLCVAILIGKMIEFAWLILPSLPDKLVLGFISYLASAAGLGLFAIAILFRGDRLLARLQLPRQARS